MAKLYELAAAYRSLQQLIEDGDENDWAQALDTLQGSITEKAENIARIIRSIDSDADSYNVEAKRLADKARACNNAVVRLKEYLKQNLEAMGLDKVKGELFTVALQSNPPACNIVDEEAIPLRFKVLVPEHWELAPGFKARVIEIWMAEEYVTGTEVTQGKHVRIR